ncbi:MAG TPA: hypothetical protein VGR96_10515 [Acidobacteriaceae bacterium]|nr:hypothetical protein [Acidobacteriaceae bacterium]
MKRIRFAALAVAAIVPLAPLPARAQAVDVQSSQQLMQEAAPLREQAKQGNGMASKILEKYPGHYTMLGYRGKDGQAELHEGVADFFVVLEGHATLLSGGKVLNPKPSGPGEVRGDAVQGGASRKLAKGDVVHIPANVPHQLLIPAGESFTYFIIKVDTPK